MKKILIVTLCVLMTAGLFVACDGSANGNNHWGKIIESLKIRETKVESLKADGSAPALVSSNWTELGLEEPVVEYLKSDMTTTTSDITEAAAVRITAEGQTAIVNLDK